MNKILLVIAIGMGAFFGAAAQGADLRIVIIRHAEKPLKGDGLTCQGENRSRLLTELIHSRWKVPAAIYIPNKGKGDTKRSRMYLTIKPFVEKYGGNLSSKYHEDELGGLATDIRRQTGVVLVVWEHGGIPEIARKLGVRDEKLKWKDSDYDSIWIIRFEKGQAVLVKDSEGLKPDSKCS